MLTLYGTARRKLASQSMQANLYPFVARGFSASSRPTIVSVPEMPIVKAVADRGKNLVDFKKTAFFGVQHILRTNIPLFQHLISTLGANPNYIFLNSKGYSDCEETEDALDNLGIHYFKLNPSYIIPGRYQYTIRAHLKKSWEIFTQKIKRESIEKVIVFDEGGHCFETMPESLCFKYPMVGIEQTRGGLYSPAVDILPFPLIEVASSAAKRHLESPFIIKALINKLKEILVQNNQELNLDTVFGVLGNGAIGYHLTQYLLSCDYKVIAFDENPASFVGPEWRKPNFYRAKDAREVLVRAGYILGCTGKDVIKSRDVFDGIATDKTLVSCTSEDKEFKTLLYEIGKNENRQLPQLLAESRNVYYTTESGGKITLVNGGFPVNFDHSGESVPANEIQLTRALMLGALIQGSRQAEQIKGQGRINQPPRIMLDPVLQYYIAQQFKLNLNEYPELIKKWPQFDDLRSIEKKSGGSKILDTELITAFSAPVQEVTPSQKPSRSM